MSIEAGVALERLRRSPRRVRWGECGVKVYLCGYKKYGVTCSLHIRSTRLLCAHGERRRLNRRLVPDPHECRMSVLDPHAVLFAHAARFVSHSDIFVTNG